MPTFILITQVAAAAAALTVALVALDLWVRREAARGKYIVRERPYTICSAHIAQTLRREKEGRTK